MNCQNRIERALSKEPGVFSSQVEYRSGKAEVRIDSAGASGKLLIASQVIADSGKPVPKPNLIAFLLLKVRFRQGMIALNNTAWNIWI